MGLGLTFWTLIVGLPAIIIDILPALLNKQKEMANLSFLNTVKLDFHWIDHLAYYFYQYE